MLAQLQNLIDALRDELQQYGEMLAQLDHQQELIMVRAPDEILHSIGAIQCQTAAMNEARQHRERCFNELAGALQQSSPVTFERINPFLPEEYRPLVGALVQENNELLVRVQQRARQNYTLLNRSLELMQRFINTLVSPQSPATVYDDEGALFSGPQVGRALYEAVG